VLRGPSNQDFALYAQYSWPYSTCSFQAVDRCLTQVWGLYHRKWCNHHEHNFHSMDASPQQSGILVGCFIFLFGCWSHFGWALLVLSWLLVALVDNYQEKLYTICDRKQLKDHSNH
jgi:hypothetical protein